jgi:hypothetical protein
MLPYWAHRVRNRDLLSGEGAGHAVWPVYWPQAPTGGDAKAGPGPASVEPFHNIDGACGEAQRMHDAQKLVLVDRVESDREVNLQHKEVLVVDLH